MKNFILLFSLISLPVLAVETATMTSAAPMATIAPEATIVPVQKVAKKAAKQTVKKKHANKKLKARNACLKGNPSLAQHKKRLNRCIKRKMNGSF